MTVHWTQRMNDIEAHISKGTAQDFSSTSLRLLYCELVMIIYRRFIFPFLYCLNMKELARIPHQSLSDPFQWWIQPEASRSLAIKIGKQKCSIADLGDNILVPSKRSITKNQNRYPLFIDLLKKKKGTILDLCYFCDLREHSIQTKEKKLSSRDCMGLRMTAE